MIVLDLVLKSRWYDLINSGQKKYEYREVKPYWSRRLFARPFTHVRFRRGYTNESMLFELTGIAITTMQNDLGLSKAYEIALGAKIGDGNNGC